MNESKYNSNIDVYDPWPNKDDVKKEYGINLINKPIKRKYDVIVLAVAHDHFKNLSTKQLKGLGKKNHIIYDLKNIFKSHETDLRL